MAQNTKATPAEIHGAANRHRTSATGFRGDNRNVQNEVDSLMAVNKGDLMNRLNALQDEWSGNVEKVLGDLDDMADYLDQVANDLQNQDSQSGGGLK